MKSNTLGFAASFCVYATFASLIISANGAAKAQVPSSSHVTNGLSYPRASERFFEKGKRSIEKETKILVNPKNKQRETLLKNNIGNRKISDELEEENPIINFPD